MVFCSILLITTHSFWRWRRIEHQGVEITYHIDIWVIVPNIQCSSSILQILMETVEKLCEFCQEYRWAFACKTCCNFCSYSQWAFLSLLFLFIWDYSVKSILILWINWTPAMVRKHTVMKHSRNFNLFINLYRQFYIFMSS
jgi:hypothetical protein